MKALPPGNAKNYYAFNRNVKSIRGLTKRCFQLPDGVERKKGAIQFAY